MLAKLKKSCPDCTESSQKTYLKSIRALSKIAGNDEVPATHRWISKPLLAKIAKRPLVQYKRFAIAGVKALKAYGVEDNKPWWEAMRDATAKYTKVRLTGKRTKREAERWPRGGYKAIAKLAKTLHSEVAHLEGAKSLSLRDLWLYQRYFVLLFYSRHTIRGDLADVRTKRGTKPQSWIYKKKRGGYHMHIGQHKTVKSRGALEIDLDPAVDKALDKFLPMVRKKTKHGFLLTTRTGTRMKRVDMMLLIANTTEAYLGKRIGIQLMRVMKTTGNLKSLEKAHELQAELGHSAFMQRQYISKA